MAVWPGYPRGLDSPCTPPHHLFTCMSLPMMATSAISHSTILGAVLYCSRQCCARCLPVTTPSLADCICGGERGAGPLSHAVAAAVLCHLDPLFLTILPGPGSQAAW